MKMDVGLDTGDILLQSETAIDEEENAIDLMARLSFEGANLLSETLKKLNEINSQKQNDAEASYAPMLTKEEGKINWESRAVTIRNHVRGFQPFPTSYTSFQGKKMTIWKSEIAEISVIDVRPTTNYGEILHVSKEDFVVSCGNETALKITELQIEGKNRMSAKDFLNGVKIKVGDKLG